MLDAAYTGVATSTGDGRAGGRVTTDDGLIDLTLAIPRELGGPGGATNPEQLFAAGWASCFHSALKAVASREKVSIKDSTVTAEVGIRKLPGHTSYTLIAALRVVLPGLEQDVAERLVELTHNTCPYSVATRGNVPVTLTVTVDEGSEVGTQA